MHKKLRYFFAALLIFSATPTFASVQDVFSHYDVDSNGYLSKTEVDSAYAAIAAGFGTSSSSVNFNKWADLNENGFVNFDDYGVVNALINISAKNLADTNKDGKLVLPEILAAFVRVQNSFGTGINISGYDYTADFNSNDFINLDDYSAVNALINADAALLVKYNAFKAVDTDSNGIISYEEAIASTTAISNEFGSYSTNPLADVNGNGFVNFDDTSTLMLMVQEVSPDVYARLNPATISLNAISNQSVNPSELLAVKITASGRALDPSQDVITVEGVGKVLALGDVNKDGRLSTTDVVYITRYLSNSVALDNEQKLLADLNQDGNLTQTDADRLLNVVMNINSSSSTYSIGDVSRDGSLTITDALYINRYLLNQIQLDDEQKFLADFNRDGAINQTDVNDLTDVVLANLNSGAGIVYPGIYLYLWTPTQSDAGTTKNVTLKVNGQSSGSASFAISVSGSSNSEDITLNAIDNKSLKRGSLLSTLISGTGLSDWRNIEITSLPAGQVYALGDVSMNGDLSSYDSALILQYVNNSGQLDDKQKLLADVNQDGFITEADSQLLLEVVAGNTSFSGKYLLLQQIGANDYAGVSTVRFVVTAKIKNSNASTDTAFNLTLEADKVATPTANVDLAIDGPIRITRNSSASLGTVMSFRARVRNGGTETTGTDNFEVKVEVQKVSGEVVYSETVDMQPLRRRQSRYINFNWGGTTAGNYIIRVTADSGNDIAETNEDNNVSELGLFYLANGQSGAFAISAPDYADKWRTADREKISVDGYGLLRRGGTYRFELVGDNGVQGPYDLATRGSSTLYHYPTAAGEFRVRISPCDSTGCGSTNTYYVQINSTGSVTVEQNPRVKGVSDDYGVEVEDVVYDDEEEYQNDEVLDDSEDDKIADEDFVTNEATMVQTIDDKLTNRLRGRILLQVENRGEAWYVDPVTGDKFYLKDGLAAYTLFRRAGLGITNNDLSKIPVGLTDYNDEDSDDDGLPDLLEKAIGTDPEDSDSDDDGFDDKTEVMQLYNPKGVNRQGIDNALTNRLKGKILLQVEDRGQAWYVNPVDGKRYLLSNGDQAYRILRNLSLGIKNSDLRKISVGVWE